jgi:hypothetical protein
MLRNTLQLILPNGVNDKETKCTNTDLTIGLDNFKSDIHKMLGHIPNIYWRICWKIISPAFLAVSIQCKGKARNTY